MSTTFNLHVANESGATANIALFRKQPGFINNGVSFIWFERFLPNDCHTEMCWNTDWALGIGRPWPFTPESAPSIVGQLQPMHPNLPNGINEVTVIFDGIELKFVDPQHISSIPLGSMVVKTETFDLKETENISLDVCLDGRPTFATGLRPNELYKFETKPTYYLCTTTTKVGMVVDSTNCASIQEIVFEPGNTQLCYKYDDTKKFVRASCGD